MRWIGIALVLAGVLALVYGGFSFTKDEKKAQIGPLEVRVQEEERVHIAPWIGFAAIAAGIVMIVADRRRARA